MAGELADGSVLRRGDVTPLHTEDDLRAQESMRRIRGGKTREPGKWRRQVGPVALVCGLACWLVGPFLGDSLFAAGASVSGVIAGAVGLGIPERRAQSVAGFVLALLYLVGLVGTVTLRP